MCYRVIQCQISSKNSIYDYCSSYAGMAKRLYNAALFRIRQIFTGFDKDNRSANEQEVFDEVELLQKTYPSIHVKQVISYSHLEKLMRVTDNPDFFAGLPMQTAQHVLKQAAADFKNWLASLRDYKKHPSKYLGKPKLKLPRTRERLYLSNIRKGTLLKEVKIKPFYGRFIISLTVEYADTPDMPTDRPNICAVDFGADNFAAIVCNDSSSKLYKGGAVLSCSQWFSKERARAAALITKGHKNMHASSVYLDTLSAYHANFIKDQCHKISTDIIRYCIRHNAGTLILGDNRLWKQNTSIGRQNNQNFVLMPIGQLRQMIMYKADEACITVILQEESYTSKADITAMDLLPVYGVNDNEARFSGRRIKRGLYKCSNGIVINADCNGAANIMRKAVNDAWNGVSDFSFLASPEVSGFHELNPKSNPVKRIGTA